jgi:hypothetical protein
VVGLGIRGWGLGRVGKRMRERLRDRETQRLSE